MPDELKFILCVAVLIAMFFAGLALLLGAAINIALGIFLITTPVACLILIFLP